MYVPYSDFLGGSQGHIGLGARADLRSCSEWYLDNALKKGTGPATLTANDAAKTTLTGKNALKNQILDPAKHTKAAPNKEILAHIPKIKKKHATITATENSPNNSPKSTK